MPGVVGGRTYKMDDEIQETVEAILGKGIKVVDCEKKSSIKEEEVLLVNGCPIALDGDDGAAIKEALLHGNVPNCDLLNQILVRAGILQAPIKLETSLSVKSSVVTREEVTVAKGGQVVDERSRETKEDNFYTSCTSEIWEPVGVLTNNTFTKINSVSDTSASPQNKTATNIKLTNHLNNRSGIWKNVHNTPGNCSTNSDSTTSSSNESDFTDTSCSTNSGACTSPKYRETKISSTTTKSSLQSEDETDFYHSSCVTDPTMLDKRIHLMSLNGMKSADSDDALFGAVCGNITPTSKGRDKAKIQKVLPQKVCFSDVNSEIFNDPSVAPEELLIYSDGVLVSGNLDSLIKHMVPTVDYYPDKAYIFAFLLSSRLFIKPHELLGSVISKCDSQQKMTEWTPENKERLVQFIPRLVQLMGAWSELFPYDFRDERVMGHVRAITHQCVSINPLYRHDVSTLLQNLLQRLTDLEHYEQFLQSTSTNVMVHSTEYLNPVDVIELCTSPAILAEQLCHIELERLSFIGPEEFVQSFAKEYPNIESSLKDMKRTRNLESYVQWFNRLSYLVGTEICKHAKKKQRIKMVEYWIEVARECFNIGNFNSLMGIIAGLNMSPVSRLRKTWSKVQMAKFSVLEHQMDPSSNFSSYRSTLKAAIWRSTGTTDERQRIVIPFFSLFVKDIYFLNEACCNRLPNGFINFEKFWQLAKQVSEFMAWKQISCPFSKNSKIVTFLQSTPVLSEKALSLTSFECEAPENNTEKERYKILRSGSSSQQ